VRFARDYDEPAGRDRGGVFSFAAVWWSESLKIAILGTGGVGAALGARWAKACHEVAFGSRQPLSEKVLQVVEKCGTATKALSPTAAIDQAEVILLAVPWSVARESLALLGDLRGRPVIDCTNPLLADLSGIELGHSTSASEQLAAAAPTARIVKAFNTASVKVMNDPQFGDHQATMFYCGDDAAAKTIVRQLIVDIGFEPADAGPLSSARYLEPLAMLYIHLAFKQGWGSNCAFKVMKR
jgi:NADPH-dependent F420 reductase